MLISIAGRNCSLSAKWFSASSIMKLNRVDWMAEWNSNHHCTINHLGKRYSVGVLEESLNIKLPKKKIYSLAAIYNDEIKNGIALFSLETFDNTKLYWVALYNSGVPELEVSGSDLGVLVDTVVNRLSDTVADLLIGERADFHSNILDSNDRAEESALEKLLSKRNFMKVSKSYDELTFVVEHSKASAFKAGEGFSLSTLGAYAKNSKKNKDAIYVVLTIFLMLGAGIYLFYPDKEIIYEEISSSYKPPVAVVDNTSKIEKQAKELIKNTLRDYLLGANLGLYNKYKNWFMDLDGYSYGYSKTGLTCAIASARCEVVYNAEGLYKDFDGAYAELSGYFDELIFTVDGNRLTGVKYIGREDVYLGEHSLSELKDYDKGLGLVGIAQELSSIRPNLSVSITSGNLVTVEGKDKDFKFPEGIEKQFYTVGWLASGVSHQSDLVLSRLNRKFLTLNSFSIKKDNGWNFTMTGGYIMRGLTK